MKVTLKNEITSSDPLSLVLKNRGVSEEDIPKYLNPTDELMPDYWKLDNLKEGIELLAKHVESGSNIAYGIDVDMDGLASASILRKYLINYLGIEKDKLVEISPEGKKHGILMHNVTPKVNKGDLLIITDAGSSDFEQHNELHELGIDVLVVDHHLAEKRDTPAIIINNQLSDDFENKALTGSAMTYLFCLAYSETYGLKPPYDLMDLSATGMIADRADFSKDLGAYYLMREGLKRENIHSKMLQLVIKKNRNLSDDRDLTAKDIGFNVAPLFNAAFRMGKPEELEQVIHGFCEFDYTLYNSRKKMEQSIIEEGCLRAEAIKRRQKKAEDEVLEAIHERIKEKGSDRYKVLIVNATGIVEDKGLNGLLAMKIASHYKKPTLMVKVVGDELKGSARNINNSPVESFNNLLTETGLFTCQGHDNAFGVSFKLQDALNVQQVLEEKLKDVDFNDAEYDVDFQWEGFIDVEAIHKLGENSEIWCNGIDEPLIHIKDKIINKNDIGFIGSTGRTMKLDVQGVDCVKFNLTESEKHEIATASDYIKMNLVCTASLNTFRGVNMPQLMIEDFTIENEDGYDPFGMLDMDELPF